MNGLCSFYYEGNNNTLHIFFSCNFSRNSWQRTGLARLILGMIDHCPQRWFKKLVEARSFELEFFGMLAYYLRFHRNKAIFEGTMTDVFSLIALATHARHDYWDANKWLERSAPSLLSRSWIQPQDNCCKVFFDGSIFSSNLCSGSGIYIEDKDDNFVFGASRSFQGIRHPHLAEMMALRECLNTVTLLGIGPTSIIGNTQLVFLEALG